MPNKRRAGIIQVKANGIQYDAKGEFTYNLGHPKNSALVGADRVHGYKTEVQIPMIEGKITDSGNLDVKSVVTLVDVTVTIQLDNGKIIAGKEMWYAGDGNITTSEGEIDLKFESDEVLEEIT